MEIKGLYNAKLLPLDCAFLSDIQYFRSKIGIQFHNTHVVVEQSNYTTKSINAYLYYNLDNWPKNPLRNFALIIAYLVRLI